MKRSIMVQSGIEKDGHRYTHISVVAEPWHIPKPKPDHVPPKDDLYPLVTAQVGVKPQMAEKPAPDSIVESEYANAMRRAAKLENAEYYKRTGSPWRVTDEFTGMSDAEKEAAKMQATQDLIEERAQRKRDFAQSRIDKRKKKILAIMDPGKTYSVASLRDFSGSSHGFTLATLQQLAIDGAVSIHTEKRSRTFRQVFRKIIA